MTTEARLLIAGGDTDPQLVRLLKRAAARGVAAHTLLTGQSGSPCLQWDIQQNRLLDQGKEVQVTAAFIRQDVFAYLQTKNSQDSAWAREWFVTVAGWLMSNPEIKVFNRPFLSHGPVNKPYVLHLALQLGLPVTPSFVSNDLEFMYDLTQQGDWIRKPVTGGSYCEVLEVVKGRKNRITPYPRIIQKQLAQPEIRIFRVGEQWFAFKVISEALDYRVAKDTRLEQTEVPSELREKMQQLADILGLTFAAADFKTDPETGELQFLEINTNPMFIGFDQAAGGSLCDAMLSQLLLI